MTCKTPSNPTVNDTLVVTNLGNIVVYSGATQIHKFGNIFT